MGLLMPPQWKQALASIALAILIGLSFRWHGAILNVWIDFREQPGWLASTISLAFALVVVLGLRVARWPEAIDRKCDKLLPFFRLNRSGSLAFALVGAVVGVSACLNAAQPTTILEPIWTDRPSLVYFLAIVTAHAIVPALMDETVVRGLLLKGMVRWLGASVATLSCSLASAMFHWQGDPGFAFFVSVALALSVLFSGSLLPAIIGHLGLNLLYVAEMYGMGLWEMQTYARWLLFAGFLVLLIAVACKLGQSASVSASTPEKEGGPWNRSGGSVRPGLIASGLLMILWACLRWNESGVSLLALAAFPIAVGLLLRSPEQGASSSIRDARLQVRSEADS